MDSIERRGPAAIAKLEAPKKLGPKQLAWCRENLSGFKDLETITAGMTGEAAKKLPLAQEMAQK